MLELRILGVHDHGRGGLSEADVGGTHDPEMDHECNFRSDCCLVVFTKFKISSHAHSILFKRVQIVTVYENSAVGSDIERVRYEHLSV